TRERRMMAGPPSFRGGGPGTIGTSRRRRRSANKIQTPVALEAPPTTARRITHVFPHGPPPRRRPAAVLHPSTRRLIGLARGLVDDRLPPRVKAEDVVRVAAHRHKSASLVPLTMTVSAAPTAPPRTRLTWVTSVPPRSPGGPVRASRNTTPG